MQTIPKKSYQYSIDDLATLDEKRGILCSNPEQSEQLKFIQKVSGRSKRSQKIQIMCSA